LKEEALARWGLLRQIKKRDIFFWHLRAVDDFDISQEFFVEIFRLAAKIR
jgi:hypothetical protein